MAQEIRDSNSAIGKDQLLLGTERGDEIAVTSLLGGGADVNYQNSQRVTALYVAVQTRNLRIARMLLEAGARTDMQDTSGWCALHKATMMEDADALRLLLKHGANVNQANNRGVTCLHLCVTKLGHHADVIAYILLQHGADVNLRDGKGNSAFALSISLHKMAVFDVMCKFRPSVRRFDRNGLLPLHIAALNNNASAIDKLVKMKAKPEAVTRDERGVTALLLATQQQHVEAVAMLRKHGCSISTRDTNGASPIEVALNMDDQLIIKTLLQFATPRDVFQVS